MLGMVTSLWQWCLPKTCLICGFISDDPDIDLCTFCRQNLPWLANSCDRCSGSITPAEGQICNRCRNAPPFDRVYALFNYKPPLRQMLRRIKFTQHLYVINLFAKLMAAQVINKWYREQVLPQVIIPMPMLENAGKSLNVNPIQEACKLLVQYVGVGIDCRVCTRTANGFVVHKHHYNYVAILVDIIKSGKTVRALCVMLQKSGVQNIDVWCIAI